MGDYDSSRWETSRVHLSGDISTANEVSLFYISCPPNPSFKAKGTILLIHGFPQTSFQFRHIITPLANAGYRVIAPDYRGAGRSIKTRGLEGYAKASLAKDLEQLLTKIGVEGKVHVVGHDIGGMVAHSFASRYPEKTKSVMWGECPQPGTEFYSKMCKTEGMWHFTFHWQPDLPELLVQGRERQYLQHFYSRLANRSAVFTPAVLDEYTDAFSQSGAMRAGFDLYRSFHQDDAENRQWVKDKGKCTVPACGFGGAAGLLAEGLEAQVGELYEKVEVRLVPDAGHWVAEENPKDCIKEILAFVAKYD